MTESEYRQLHIWTVKAELEDVKRMGELREVLAGMPRSRSLADAFGDAQHRQLQMANAICQNDAMCHDGISGLFRPVGLFG